MDLGGFGITVVPVCKLGSVSIQLTSKTRKVKKWSSIQMVSQICNVQNWTGIQKLSQLKAWPVKVSFLEVSTFW